MESLPRKFLNLEWRDKCPQSAKNTVKSLLRDSGLRKYVEAIKTHTFPLDDMILGVKLSEDPAAGLAKLQKSVAILTIRAEQHAIAVDPSGTCLPYIRTPPGYVCRAADGSTLDCDRPQLPIAYKHLAEDSLQAIHNKIKILGALTQHVASRINTGVWTILQAISEQDWCFGIYGALRAMVATTDTMLYHAAEYRRLVSIAWAQTIWEAPDGVKASALADVAVADAEAAEKALLGALLAAQAATSAVVADLDDATLKESSLMASLIAAHKATIAAVKGVAINKTEGAPKVRASEPTADTAEQPAGTVKQTANERTADP
jgi:hypothetical protein